MPTTTIRARRWARAALVCGVFAASGATVACSDFLQADNPAAIPVERLADTAMIGLMENSTIQSLTGENHFWFNWLGAVFTDELWNRHVFIDEVLFDRRQVAIDNSYQSPFSYGPIMRARWLADSLIGRIRALAPDSAVRDVRVARMYAASGWQLLRLAEGWCEVPIAAAGETYAPLSNSTAVFAMAEARFDSAVKIAAASRAVNSAATVENPALAQRYVLAADSITNLANLGSAKGALGRNDLTKAAAKARLVVGLPTAWEWRVYNNQTSGLGLRTRWGERLAGGSGVTSAAISNTPFLNLDDARVPHPRSTTTGLPLAEPTMSGSWVVANSPRAFQTFDGTKTGADPNDGIFLQLGSLLEAQYIVAEAEGATAANIAFIESRRLAFPSNTATTVTTASNFLSNLQNQRARDFFLAGTRLGDLRRWTKYRGFPTTTSSTSVMGWPTGQHPGSATGVTFGNQMCWPIIVAEITNNPMIPKPYTPPIGP